MSRRHKGIITHAAVIMTAIVMALVLVPRTAHAATKQPKGLTRDISDCKGTITMYLEGKDEDGNTNKTLRFFYCAGNPIYNPDEIPGVLKGIKSSNKKVVEARIYFYASAEQGLVLEAKKPGTAKVSFIHKGKRRTVKVVVKKYSSPIKRLTLGGKDMTKRFRKGRLVYVGDQKLEGKKISVKAKKGWTLKGVYSAGMYFGPDRFPFKSVKNGGKLPNGTVNAYVEFQNNKTKAYTGVFIRRSAY